ncbi:MAG TPA: hypothetical protein VGD67_28535 [Pseudonocardiaceae bacterium]
MSVERRDPDDPDTPGTSGPGGDPSAADVDAEFARIVAGWEATGSSRWRGPEPGEATPTEELPVAPVAPPDPTPPTVWRGATPTPLDDEDDALEAVDTDDPDEHYVPPEPPPLPRPQPATLGAVGLVLLGVLLLVAPEVIGMSSQYGLPLGLLAIAGAVVWLIVRLRQGPPSDSGWDDGAQI